MANDFSSKIDVLFEDVVLDFEAQNVSSKNVSQYKAPSGMLAEAGQTFYRPVDLLTEVVDGRDISSSINDLTELTVPSTLTDSNLRNVPVRFTGTDLNNPHMYKRAVESASKMLSNKLDTLVANEVSDKGALVVTNSTSIDSYTKAAYAETLMLEQQATKGMRCMLLNPGMAQNILGDLAGRETFSGKAMSAYERSALAPIAGFDTFRTDYMKSIVGSSGSGYLVNGASQTTTPAAKSGGLPVDNRSQTLTVDTGSAAAVGDSFTIAGVYAVGHVNKQSTGKLKTFRITAISGSDWTICPAIIPADGAAQAQKDYGNVDTAPADNAAITILNTTTAQSSVFFEKSAVEIVHSEYNLDEFRATGKKVRSALTDSGIQIAMICDSNVETLASTHRMFIWANVEVLNPEAAGIMLEGQV